MITKTTPKTLDAAYERLAMTQGMNTTPVFRENLTDPTGEIQKQVWPKVVRDMMTRNEEGRVKYNRYLQTDCPDNMLQHAYEEALDLTVYLKTLLEKNK